MKLLFIILLPTLAYAQPVTHTLKSGSAKYEVSYLTKTVDAESKDVKGKIVCDTECEFLFAIPLKTFDSGDSNRDLNMQNTVDAATYPVVSAKGKFDKSLWGQKDFSITALVNFHGIDVSYPVRLSENGRKASLTLNLEKHKIERPTLFTVKIDNEVPIEFKFEWAE